jgi:POT family proton-dependent oligopeptide transporter
VSGERHPKGLYVLFFTEMWERFGFYSMLAMFTLYLRNDKQGFSWLPEDATRLYANYLMLVYASPLVGGLIADRELGYRNSVLIGGLVFMVGYFLLAIHDIRAVYAALACLIVGNGFFKPNVSAMVGHLYPEGSALKDRAYNIFYMGINIGALLAPINSEWMVRVYGFNVAFAAAGVGMILSVIILWTFKSYVERAQAPLPWGSADADVRAAGSADLALSPEGSTGVVTEPSLTGVSTQPSAPPGPAPALPKKAHPIDLVPDSTRIGALIVIFAIVIVFWMVFHQNGSTITYWADDNTAWKVSGIISNAINPFWVVTLTFPVVWFWHWLAGMGKEPSIPAKMALGMCLTAASFAVLYAAARTGEATEVTPELLADGDFRVTDRSLDNLRAEGVPEEALAKLQAKEKDQFVILGKKFATDEASSGAAKLTGALEPVLGKQDTARYREAILKQAYLFKVSPLWLILAVAVVTLGELMLSPMGLSLVSKVAPERTRGVMMGGWFVATAIGNKLTMIGVYWDVWRQSTFFAVLGAMALAMGLVLFALLRPLKKAMPGV